MNRDSRCHVIQGRGRLDGIREYPEYNFVEIRIVIDDRTWDSDGRWNVIIGAAPKNSEMHRMAIAASRHDLEIEWRIEDAKPYDDRPYAHTPAPLARLRTVEPLPDPDVVLIPDFPPAI